MKRFRVVRCKGLRQLATPGDDKLDGIGSNADVRARKKINGLRRIGFRCAWDKDPVSMLAPTDSTIY